MRLAITFKRWEPNIIRFRIHCVDPTPLTDKRLFMFRNVNAAHHQKHLRGRYTYCQGFALSPPHVETQLSAILTHLSNLLADYGNFTPPPDIDVEL